MFHFSRYPRTRSPWIAIRLNIGPGCPIRISPDQRLLATSPELFAGCYVLHRLFVSRHPPYALSCSSTTETRKRSCVIAFRFTGVIRPSSNLLIFSFQCSRVPLSPTGGGFSARSGKRNGVAQINSLPYHRFPLLSPMLVSFEKDRLSAVGTYTSNRGNVNRYS